jgi:hypothetical protein
MRLRVENAIFLSSNDSYSSRVVEPTSDLNSSFSFLQSFPFDLVYIFIDTPTRQAQTWHAHLWSPYCWAAMCECIWFFTVGKNKSTNQSINQSNDQWEMRTTQRWVQIRCPKFRSIETDVYPTVNRNSNDSTGLMWTKTVKMMGTLDSGEEDVWCRTRECDTGKQMNERNKAD